MVVVILKINKGMCIVIRILIFMMCKKLYLIVVMRSVGMIKIVNMSMLYVLWCLRLLLWFRKSRRFNEVRSKVRRIVCNCLGILGLKMVM